MGVRVIVNLPFIPLFKKRRVLFGKAGFEPEQTFLHGKDG